MIWTLTIFEEDDATVWREFSTDPGHARPYLHVPTQVEEQEVDFARGSASIGQVNFALIDPPTIAGDQNSGYVTASLANAVGQTAWMGRRAVMQHDRGAGPVTVINGVVSSLALSRSFAGYRGTLLDIRERERQIRAFVSSAYWNGQRTDVVDAPVVWPRGRVRPYGKTPTGHILPAAGFVAGTYLDYAQFEEGEIRLPAVNANRVPLERIVTQLMLDQMKPDERHNYTKVRLRWRVPGGVWRTTGPIQFTQIHDLLAPVPGRYVNPTDGSTLDVQYAFLVAWKWTDASPRPVHNSAIEVQVVYVGEPTKDYPFRWEGESGALLAALYDGAFSDTPPRIPYDAATVAAFKTPFALTRDKPADDLRDWTEKHWYAIQGAAPVLSSDAKIAPVRYALPDASVAVVQLNDTNCFAEPGWEHTLKDAINIVVVEYTRESAVSAVADPMQLKSSGDGVSFQKVRVEHRNEKSIKLIGEQPLELKPETVTAFGLGGIVGGILSRVIGNGDTNNEVGHQLAEERARQALDRFVLGGQHYNTSARRSDPAVEALRVGDWVIDATSWKPEYSTGRRGANRLAQIVARRNRSPVRVEFQLIDAGPANQPLGQPTLGALTADADGVVTIPFTALAFGSEGAAYYAVSAVVPDGTSPLWTFAGRVEAPGTVYTPPVPAGATVWVRARGEAVGRRPSAFTNGVSITVAPTPRLLTLRVSVSETGVATVTWERNAYVGTVRVRYSIHVPDAIPLYAQVVTVSGGAGALAIPDTVPPGMAVSVVAEPWSGAVDTSTMGPASLASATRPVATMTASVALAVDANNLVTATISPADATVTATLNGAAVALGGSGGTRTYQMVRSEAADQRLVIRAEKSGLLPGSNTYTIDRDDEPGLSAITVDDNRTQPVIWATMDDDAQHLRVRTASDSVVQLIYSRTSGITMGYTCPMLGVNAIRGYLVDASKDGLNWKNVWYGNVTGPPPDTVTASVALAVDANNLVTATISPADATVTATLNGVAVALGGSGGTRTYQMVRSEAADQRLVIRAEKVGHPPGTGFYTIDRDDEPGLSALTVADRQQNPVIWATMDDDAQHLRVRSAADGVVQAMLARTNGITMGYTCPTLGVNAIRGYLVDASKDGLNWKNVWYGTVTGPPPDTITASVVLTPDINNLITIAVVPPEATVSATINGNSATLTVLGDGRYTYQMVRSETSDQRLVVTAGMGGIRPGSNTYTIDRDDEPGVSGVHVEDRKAQPLIRATMDDDARFIRLVRTGGGVQMTLDRQGSPANNTAINQYGSVTLVYLDPGLGVNETRAYHIDASKDGVAWSPNPVWRGVVSGPPPDTNTVVNESVSKTTTTATLTLTMPAGMSFTDVKFKKQTGTGGWVGGVTGTGSDFESKGAPYTCTVNLDPKHTSSIAYQVWDGAMLLVEHAVLGFDTQNIAEVKNANSQNNGNGTSTIYVYFDTDVATGTGKGKYRKMPDTAWTLFNVSTGRSGNFTVPSNFSSTLSALYEVLGLNSNNEEGHIHTVLVPGTAP